MKSAAPVATQKATLIGFTAVLMWSLLALFTDMTGPIPPFQLAAITFFIGTLVGLIWTKTRNTGALETKPSNKILLSGGIGLFAYHALYFAAVKSAPTVEASLIAYLWPLLIVVCSALLPGEKLRWHHIIGALLGFIGTYFLVTGGSGFSLKTEYFAGYVLAIFAAFTWTAYSLISRQFAAVSTSAVVYYCAVSTALSIIAHIAFETTYFPNQPQQWLAVAGLGLLPVGAAFYVWDFGMKHGNVQVLGAASYTAPLLSTIILISFGRAAFSWPIAIACFLISFGALIAARDLIVQQR